MNTHTSLFDRIGFWSLLVTITLTPFFFLPFLHVGVEVFKPYLLTCGVLVTVISWLIARLVDGTFSIQKNILTLAGCCLLVVGFIVALFSPVASVSFFGQGLELGTFTALCTLVVAMFAIAHYFANPKRVLALFVGMFVSFAVVSLFAIAFLFFGKHLELGTFTSSVSNLIGKWNDFGIFYGLVVILSLLTLELFSVRGLLRGVLYAAIVVALFFVSLVNFVPLWTCMGIFALITFIYVLSVHRTKQTEHKTVFPFASLAVVILSLFFIIGNTTIGGILPRTLGVYQTEVRPSFGATYTVTRHALAHRPLTGVGQNRFAEAWALYRPIDVNRTPFWDTTFDSGISSLATTVTTEGILGTLAWLFFIGAFIVYGTRKAFDFSGDKDPVTQHLVLSSFVSALYIWIFFIIYNPGIVLMMYAFVFTGVFIGLLTYKKVFSVLTLNFLHDPRHSFFSILSFVALLIIGITSTYFVAEKAVALVTFSRSFSVTGTDAAAINTVGDKMLKAATLDGSDVYYRNLSSLYLVRLNATLSDQTLSKDQIKSEFQDSFSSAVKAAQLALGADATNPQNWIYIGQVYQSAVPLGVTGAYDNAHTDYLEAQKRSPMNPGVDLLLARLEADNKNLDAARTYAQQALALKSDFSDAYVFLAEIAISNNSFATAETYIEQGITASPNDASLYLQLGLIRSSQKEYDGAVSAFEQSIRLDGSSANAHYFLALAYEKVGRTADETAQLQSLVNAFPTNDTLKTALANVKAGRPAVPDTSTPVPPVKDTSIPKKK